MSPPPLRLLRVPPLTAAIPVRQTPAPSGAPADLRQEGRDEEKDDDDENSCRRRSRSRSRLSPRSPSSPPTTSSPSPSLSPPSSCASSSSPSKYGNWDRAKCNTSRAVTVRRGVRRILGRAATTTTALTTKPADSFEAERRSGPEEIPTATATAPSSRSTPGLPISSSSSAVGAAANARPRRSCSSCAPTWPIAPC